MRKASIPKLGFGTWELKGKACRQIVSWAFEEGYKHLDTAHEYENHREVGLAMKDKPRDQIFLTTKISPAQIKKNNIVFSIQAACDLALEELETDYLDLYLIHYPEIGLPFVEIFKSMERLIDQGKVRQIGVSNFTIAHMETLKKQGLHPCVNQLEFHPYLFQKELLEYCQKHAIDIISYRSLGKRKGRESGLFSEDLVLQSIGAKHQKTWAQVILRWLIQKNIHVIPKTSTRERLKENAAIFDFELSKQEILKIDALDCHKRFCMDGDPLFEYQPNA